MMSRDIARSSKDPNHGKLLNEVETINKTFYLDKSPSKNSSSLTRNRSSSVDKANVHNLKSKHVSDDLATKDKKSFWNWKPLKALSQVRYRRFNCCFTLEVHTVEGVPSKFNEHGLCVHWKRRDGEVVTKPVKVNKGIANFKEKLSHTCSIYGSRSGPHHSAKYDAKHFLLYAAIHGNSKLDLGKHRVDLTRLLPLTLEELEDEKSSGTWRTSFKLSGEAKGALMNVSFGYVVLGDTVAQIDNFVPQHLDSKVTTKSSIKFSQGEEKGFIRRSGSLPTNQKTPMASTSVDDIKILHEVPPARMSEFSNSVNMLFQKFDEEKVDPIVDFKHEIEVPEDVSEPVKQNEGLDFEKKAEWDETNIVNVQDEKNTECTRISDAVGNKFHEEDHTVKNEVQDDICTRKLLLKDLESVLSHVTELEKEGMDTPEGRSESSDQEFDTSDKPRKLMSSHSFDDLADTVADEFLSMLEVGESSVAFNSDVEPESPRERLLREFQKEAEASGCSVFGFDIDEDDVGDYEDYAPTISGWEEFCEDFDSLPVDELEYPNRARVIENMETQALMEEWGLDEKAFQCSPPHNICGFGSPIDLPPNEPSLPQLGEGLGPFVQTKAGGFLRSMNPVLFRNAKSGGSLIMQVSSPVVVPAELGSGVMDVLQHLASVGLEKLSAQANKLMPLEDITGKTMQQMAWEAKPQLETSNRQKLLSNEQEGHHVKSGGKKRGKGTSSSRKQKKSSSSSTHDELDSEYVSLEDLAPLAMDKIEALSIEGLRIQSGMSDEEAPSNINAQSIGEVSAFEGKRAGTTGSVGLEGSAGMQLLNIKDNATDGNNDDGMMSLSLSLNEWMKLDSGEIDEAQPSERTAKLLEAHHASSTDLNFLRSKQGKAYGKRCGLLGNNFTVALMVQLRDPLRDYEPVGTPMLALIQVERVFVPPKPRIYLRVPEARDGNDEDDEPESSPKEEMKVEPKEEKIRDEDLIPQFKISEVHVAGLKAEPGKKKLWGNAAQQQSGSRWLLANGMGKGKKFPVMKPKIASKSPLPGTITSQPGDTLWSISARYNGSGAKWKELAALNPHIRNPNVILCNEVIKLR